MPRTELEPLGAKQECYPLCHAALLFHYYLAVLVTQRKSVNLQTSGLVLASSRIRKALYTEYITMSIIFPSGELTVLKRSPVWLLHIMLGCQSVREAISKQHLQAKIKNVLKWLI